MTRHRQQTEYVKKIERALESGSDVNVLIDVVLDVLPARLEQDSGDRELIAQGWNGCIDEIRRRLGVRDSFRYPDADA